MKNPYDALKLDYQLCFPLYAVSKEIIRRYKPFLDPFGLTYTQYITLMALWEKDNVTVKSLGERLYLDSGTLTPLLKKMEVQGWVTRNRCQENERNVYIRLTQSGVALRDDVLHIPQAISKCVTLSFEESVTLHKLLHKFLNDSNNM